MENLLYLIPLFFITALIYSSVGFGGGSTYLALLVLFQISYTAIPKIALICNILVVSGGLYHYARTKNLSLHLVLPFILTSIPFAYLGGRIPISKELFLILLGFSLLIAGIRMLFASELVARSQNIVAPKAWAIGLPVGAFLGLLSGLVGLGGGIFLSPLMYFLGWGKPKQIAASSSIFIFVNSVAGLWGQSAKILSDIEWQWLVPLMLAVVAGGQIGSRLSVGKLSPFALQRTTAVVVLLVAARIFWGFL